MCCFRSLPALGIVFLLSACTSIVDSDDRRVSSAGEAPRQSAGRYYLPKHVVHVDIVKQFVSDSDKVSGTPATTTMTVRGLAVPDTDTPSMKLALNLSSFSDDNVQAELEGGLLKLVHATATDRTGDVLTEIGRAAGTFRGTAVTSTSQAMQFDPFSEKDSLQFNRWLKSYLPGSCVAVEISPSHWSPGCEQYTGKRAKAYASSKSPRYAAEITAAASKPGIYYRQATPRRVLVVKDKKPYEIKYVAFANDAPPEELQMERGSLITRDTKASFSGGELQSITIKKDSEALAAAKLPVAIFKAYVGGMVDAVTQQSEYEKARADYITAQANRLKAETSLIKETGQLPIGGFNSSEFRTSGGGFRSSGPTDDLCRSFLRQDIQHPCAQIPR